MPAMESLRLPARLESLATFRLYALAAAAQAGLPQGAVDRLDLVLEEALVNIVHHAYGDGGGDVELSCRSLEPGRLCLALTDWGAPFDPLNAPDPGQADRMAANREAGVEDREPGGLGLFFIRTMAESSYQREAGANVLVFCIGP